MEEVIELPFLRDVVEAVDGLVRMVLPISCSPYSTSNGARATGEMPTIAVTGARKWMWQRKKFPRDRHQPSSKTVLLGVRGRTDPGARQTKKEEEGGHS